LVTGALARTQDHNLYSVNFNYDAFGSLSSTTDSLSNTLNSATYKYGIAPFKVTSHDMDMGDWSYTIDPLGELTAYTDAKTQNFSISYDVLSRPLVRTEPDLTTTWTWGAAATSFNIGKLQSIASTNATDGTYSESYGYDSAGRPSTTMIVIPNDTTDTYTTTYNATTGLLDTLEYPLSTSSYKLKLQYAYAHGILQSVADFNAPTTVFWAANTSNARGQITEETLGNGVVTSRIYDAVTGWLATIQAGVGSGAGIQNNAYLYDEMGNVTQRQDNNQALTENFFYDNLYRLDHSTLGVSTNLQMHYDAMGNITSRSDMSAGAAWTYDPVHKHQVLTAGSSSFSFAYDANGNATYRQGPTHPYTWTSANYPTSMGGPGESSTWTYGPNRQVFKSFQQNAGGNETTYHAGKLFEHVTFGGNSSNYRHYIFAGSELVAIYSRTFLGVNTLNYVQSDHQGSIASITTSSPATDYVNESFTAFGNRRNGQTWSGAPLTGDETAINGKSRWGYTGQTAIGITTGLVHMNGRVEDAVTGRFLSPDPHVFEPDNTQGWNRYSYVNNNPLTNIDPSGFCFKNSDGSERTGNCNPSNGGGSSGGGSSGGGSSGGGSSGGGSSGGGSSGGGGGGGPGSGGPGSSGPGGDPGTTGGDPSTSGPNAACIEALTPACEIVVPSGGPPTSSGSYAIPPGIAAPPVFIPSRQQIPCLPGANCYLKQTQNQTQQDQRCKNALPDGRNVNSNVRQTEIEAGFDRAFSGNSVGALMNWLFRVVPGGAWDYKLSGQPGSEAAGNFNYGATGSVFFGPLTLKSAAGVVQLATLPSNSDGGIPFVKAPYGDSAADQTDIQSGISGGCGPQ
jgi:RHS repeat-associated protein